MRYRLPIFAALAIFPMISNSAEQAKNRESPDQATYLKCEAFEVAPSNLPPAVDGVETQAPLGLLKANGGVDTPFLHQGQIYLFDIADGSSQHEILFLPARSGYRFDLYAQRAGSKWTGWLRATSYLFSNVALNEALPMTPEGRVSLAKIGHNGWRTTVSCSAN
jgi:hypothetical protein